ncbi:hypothetical protein Vadar_008431 [Vaccinium darrowii]|uniref:Uncharacterized protein n=1 Tax=Vaccinium darrowii TaxID=229202 RepID=A0ACB7YUY8_9ERIC|nr:hypothetical protein Vadar_008431 [Vaccinium darrowii]
MHSSTTTFFFIVVVSAVISTCYSQDDKKYTTCARNFSCGENFQNVGYPFWGDDRPQECGYRSFELKCQNNEYPTIEIDNRIFRVKDINQAGQTITIASSDLWPNHCTQELHNVTFDNLLHNGPMNQNLFVFYNCTSEISLLVRNFTCGTGGTESHGFYVAEESFYNEREHSELTTISCTSLKVPVSQATLLKILQGSLPLQEGLREGFEVLYDVDYIVKCSRCEDSGGICGLNRDDFVCQKRGRSNLGRSHLALILGTVVSIGGIMITLLLCIIVKKLRPRFCFESRHKALIYEFMPNGSLDKFIHGGGSLTNHQLGWDALYQIAVGIARGLEYLHRGCNTRILHFDIKPHNILLNEDFCPKISDFGLAKLCPQKESIISLLGARGTAGYIAPEVFSRNFGGVSHKSDVYSYGMMVLEMVGERKNNISVEVDHTSETYFPHWVYKRLELDEELRSDGITGDEANASTRKMIIVGLWCIQIDPSHRPSMGRVLEMLEGSLELLQIPPKPFLSSPSGAPVDSSTTQSTLMSQCTHPFTGKNKMSTSQDHKILPQKFGQLINF